MTERYLVSEAFLFFLERVCLSNKAVEVRRYSECMYVVNGLSLVRFSNHIMWKTNYCSHDEVYLVYHGVFISLLAEH